MLLVALLISGLAGPDAAPQTRTDVYAPPIVRPYEPPSNFGRQIAEGDVDASVRTRPIAAPEMVEAYSGAYEPSRTRGEISYEQGVEVARVAANGRMGPLDGAWQVRDAEGRTVMDLVLSDQGAGRPVEGALSLAGSDRIGLIDTVTAEGPDRIVTASIDGTPTTLRLRPAGEGWTGTATGPGRERTVSLVRPVSR